MDCGAEICLRCRRQASVLNNLCCFRLQADFGTETDYGAYTGFGAGAKFRRRIDFRLQADFGAEICLRCRRQTSVLKQAMVPKAGFDAENELRCRHTDFGAEKGFGVVALVQESVPGQILGSNVDFRLRCIH